jgi:lysophospholipase L1-like esterase
MDAMVCVAHGGTRKERIVRERGSLKTGLLLISAIATYRAAAQWMKVRHARRSGRNNALVGHPPFERLVPQPSARVLVVGDSTGVGVGATAPADSLAGLLASEFPAAEILNRSVNGACIADVIGQVPEGLFDVILLHIGANDIMTGNSMKSMVTQGDELLRFLKKRTRHLIWLSAGNIGLSPLFVAPWSWWMTARSRQASKLFEALSRHHGAEFISFFREAQQDVFSRDPMLYFADDLIHPSSATYRYCYAVFRRQTRIGVLLSMSPDSAVDQAVRTA